jgi:hypothetical protein
MVKSVRASAARWDPTCPGEGHYVCYLEFEDGVTASLVFNGYALFDTAELVWGIGEPFLDLPSLPVSTVRSDNLRMAFIYTQRMAGKNCGSNRGLTLKLRQWRNFMTPL